jgi:transcriptional regulator with XRE-family HTH domain
LEVGDIHRLISRPGRTGKERQRAELTQEQLSFRAGISCLYIGQLERDLKSPTVDTLIRICDARQVSAADILGRVDAARKRPSRP